MFKSNKKQKFLTNGFQFQERLSLIYMRFLTT